MMDMGDTTLKGDWNWPKQERRFTPYEYLRRLIHAELDTEYVIYPKTIADTLAIPHDVVKAILRDLRDNGYARYTTAWCEDEYTPRGSGYVKVKDMK